jgi:hypothetical protein
MKTFRTIDKNKSNDLGMLMPQNRQPLHFRMVSYQILAFVVIEFSYLRFHVSFDQGESATCFARHTCPMKKDDGGSACLQ